MHSISFVLLDMTMPKMNGQECFKAIQAIQPHVKVILSSGYSATEASRLFSANDLSGFLQKPYSPTGLAEKVGSILKQPTT